MYLCEKCLLFPKETYTNSRKIKPSNIYCSDCIRIEKCIKKTLTLEEYMKEANDKKLPISISFLQRKFKITYEKAKKILEEIGKI